MCTVTFGGSGVSDCSLPGAARPRPRSTLSMSTRSGLLYKIESAKKTTMSLTESGRLDATSTDGMAELLLEDRRARDRELAQERARQESAQTHQSKQLEEQLQIMKTVLDRTLDERRGLESCAPPEITLTKLEE